MDATKVVFMQGDNPLLACSMLAVPRAGEGLWVDGTLRYRVVSVAWKIEASVFTAALVFVEKIETPAEEKARLEYEATRREEARHRKPAALQLLPEVAGG